MDRKDYEWAMMQQVQWLTMTMAATLNSLEAKGIISREQVNRAAESLNSHRQGVVPDAMMFFDTVEEALRNPNRQL